MQSDLNARRFIVRTRVDEHPNHSEERRNQALGSMAQILTTDYPPRVREESYTVSFADGKTIRKIKM